MVIRHRLAEPWLKPEVTSATTSLRLGHATRMLRLGLDKCRLIGLDCVLLTCDPANEASRRVILANRGVAADRTGEQDRYWIDLQDVPEPT